MTTDVELARDLELLEEIERDPDVTQASLAEQLGVAIGTVNWHIKRLIEKGYVKVRRAQRRKLRYIITAEGISFRARLAVNYIEQSLRLYRRVRQRVLEHLEQVRAKGYAQVRIEGESDLAEICRLTCLEQRMPVVNNPNVPCLVVRGTQILLEMESQ